MSMVPAVWCFFTFKIRLRVSFHSHEFMSWQQWHSPELHFVISGTALGCCWITTVVGTAMLLSTGSLKNMKKMEIFFVHACPLSNFCSVQHNHCIWNGMKDKLFQPVHPVYYFHWFICTENETTLMNKKYTNCQSGVVKTKSLKLDLSNGQ